MNALGLPIDWASIRTNLDAIHTQLVRLESIEMRRLLRILWNA